MIGAFGTSRPQGPYVLRRNHIVKVLASGPGIKGTQERFLYCVPESQAVVMLNFKMKAGWRKPSIRKESTIPGGVRGLLKRATQQFMPLSIRIDKIHNQTFKIKDMNGREYTMTW